VEALLTNLRDTGVAMIHHLKIGPLRALNTTTLTDLGRLNVFCGPNGAGKSTVLAAILMDECREGLVFDDPTVKEFAERVGGAWGAFNITQLLQYELVFRQVFGAHEESAWFRDEEEEFMRLLEGATKVSGFFHNRDWNRGHVVAGFRASFPKRHNLALLPESRRLETSEVIQIPATVSPNGGGVVNYLFFAKNQLPTDVMHLQYTRIVSAFEELSDGFTFTIVQEASPNIGQQMRANLQFMRRDDRWMTAIDCAYGLRELLFALVFSVLPQHDVILYEEPEAHMHPEMQRRLATYLRSKTEKQYFISTHSNVFLRPGIADRVFALTLDASISVSDATSRTAMLAELGYDIADNLVSDVVILVEGPSDIPVIESLLVKFGIVPQFRVRCWPLGGDNMARVDLSPLQERSRLIAIVDKDPGSTAARKRFVEACKHLSIPVTRLKRRAIENYFPLFGGQVPSDLQAIDPDEKVSDQLGFDPKAKNWNIAQLLEPADVADTDLSSFMEQVRSLCELSLHRAQTTIYPSV
jgi:hypothetical protein